MRTANVNNMIMERCKPADPIVGMGATRLQWTDRTACTIVEVQKTKAGSIKAVVVTQDIATRTDNNGMSESQDYSYTPNPEGGRITYTKRSNGAFVVAGSSIKHGERLLVGHRESYYDYSF